MTKQEAVAYFQKLATEAGIPDEQRSAFAAALGNEKFADAVAKGFMLDADYSRGKQEVAAQAKKYQDDWNAVNQWYEQNKASLTQAQQLAVEKAQYEALYGPLNDPKQPNNGAGTLTEETLKKLLDERIGQIANGVGTLVKSTTRASADHWKRFGEPLDVDAFDEFLGERRKANPNIDIDSAYKAYIEPKLEEKQKTQFDEAIKKAREEGRTEALSTRRIPIDNGNKEFAPAWDPKRFDLTKGKSDAEVEQNAENEFFKGYEEAAQANR